MVQLRSKLRQVWAWSPMRREALNKAKTSRGVYLCSSCSKGFGPKEVQVDHIDECGTLKGLSDIPNFTGNLFCDSTKLRVLCKTCHQARTNESRAHARQLKNVLKSSPNTKNSQDSPK